MNLAIVKNTLDIYCPHCRKLVLHEYECYLNGGDGGEEYCEFCNKDFDIKCEVFKRFTTREIKKGK
jgi:ribosomal protein L44E